MEKKLWFLLVLICSASLLVGCSDDDEGGKLDPLIGQIAGTYEGQLTVMMDKIHLSSSNQYIFVTEDSKSSVKLELRDFSVPLQPGEDPFSIGDIVVSGIKLEGDNSNVALKETKVVINHPQLGALNVTVSGTVANKKADLHIVVLYAGAVNIDVDFDGVQVSSEINDTDYAALVTAWYGRVSLTGTDMEEVKYPNTGIEFTRYGLNDISIKSFSLSCINPSTGKSITRNVALDSVRVSKKDDGIYILPIKTILINKTYGDATLDLSGKVVGEDLTLNMTLTQGESKTEYVYVGAVKRNETKLEKFTVAGDVVMVQPEVSGTAVVLYVKPGTTKEQLKLVPSISCSDGATFVVNNAEYVPGTTVDFSSSVKIKVTAESGSVATYTVTTKEMTTVSPASNFDTWTTTGTDWQKYDVPETGWETSNKGVFYIKLIYSGQYAKDKPYVVTSTDDSKSGKAARLESVNTNPAFAVSLAPVVTSGTIFTGEFSVNISNTLKSTKFGAPCMKEPKSFKGSYKYTSGPVFYNCADISKTYEVTVVQGKKDAPAMNAVLYEVSNYSTDVLDGTDLLTSEKIVAVASVDGKEQASYTDFDVKFAFKSGKSYDSSKKYKLAIVCSSSKDGDKFTGAPGSVLYVDNLEVTF